MTLPTNLQETLDATINQAMNMWNIPGLALAIVKDDEVALAKGYGVRQIGKPEKVDADTLFAIGSNTKAFTAAALGLLVQEGKIAWDDRVSKYLPYFQLYDANASQLITIRDLLCHRCGLATWAGDILLLSDYSTEDIIRRIRHIPPGYGFRDGYGYSNLMFVTAGQIISVVTGLSWDAFIHQRLFTPLGITDSVTNPRDFGDRVNAAVPHEEVNGRVQTVPYRPVPHAGAEGSICASVSDLAKWLRFQLNRGRLDGKQIADPDMIEETRTPHTPIRLLPAERKLFPSRHFSAYGLGWFLNDHQGKFMVRHTGGVDGMLSVTGFLPEENLGVAVLTNKLPNSAYVALHMYLLESMIGTFSQDWIKIYLDVDKETRQKAQEAKEKVRTSRATGTRPTLPLKEYAGTYDDPIAGEAYVSEKDGRLHIQLQAHASMSGNLEHWHYDTFLCKWDDPVLAESPIPFITDGQGHVTEFRVKIREDWIDPIEHIFRKTA